MGLGRENETKEYKRSTSELDAALIDMTAILNKHFGGEIYFGVNNNGDIVGQNVGVQTCSDISRRVYEKIKPVPNVQVDELTHNGKTYIKVSFTGTDVPYSFNDQYYYRVSEESRKMTRTQLKEMFSSLAYCEKEWENAPTTLTIEYIDEKVLKNAFDDGVAKERLSGNYVSKEITAKKFGIFDGGVLTNAGKYLFSNFGPIVVKMAIFATNDKITFLDLKRFEGNIYQCIDEVILYIANNIRWQAIISGGPRVDVCS